MPLQRNTAVPSGPYCPLPAGDVPDGAGTAMLHATRGCTVHPGRQSNHGDWTLPPDLSGEGPTSLWLAVATWALRAGRPVTREDVAQAFRISARRAADIITYLATTRADVVTCRREVVRVGSGHRVGFLQVTHIADAMPSAPVPPVRRTRATSRKSGTREAIDLAAARALFLGQRMVRRTG